MAGVYVLPSAGPAIVASNPPATAYRATLASNRATSCFSYPSQVAQRGNRPADANEGRAVSSHSGAFVAVVAYRFARKIETLLSVEKGRATVNEVPKKETSMPVKQLL